MGNKGNSSGTNSAHRLSERTYQTHTCGFLQSDICYFPCSFIAAHSIDTAAGKKGGLHNNQYICAFKEDYNNWGKLSVSFKSVGFKKKSSDEWQAFNGCPWSKMLCPTGYSYYICKQGQNRALQTCQIWTSWDNTISLVIVAHIHLCMFALKCKWLKCPQLWIFENDLLMQCITSEWKHPAKF